MAIKFNFAGKSVIEPGSYAQIINGTSIGPTTASFGKVMIIDTGSGSTWGGGSGINGELDSRKNAIYEFDDVNAYKQFIRGGLLWDLADSLFGPSNNGQGVSAIQYVKAATTTAASLTYTFTGSGDTTKIGTITTSTANAILTGVGTNFLTDLTVGSTIKTSAGVIIGVILSITDNLTATFVANSASTNTAITYKVQVPQPQGGTFTLKTRTEGIGSNAYLVSGVLAKGFAAKIMAGVLDTTKFALSFYSGTFRGVNNVEPTFSTPTWLTATTYAINVKIFYDGFIFKSLQASNTANNPLTSPTFWQLVPYNDNFGDSLAGTTIERLLVTSPEFSTMSEILNWMQSNNTFNNFFKVSSSSIVGDGIIDSSDLTSNIGYKLATGGTETYNPSDLDSVLQDIVEEDNTFFLCDRYQLEAQSSQNTKILSFIVRESEFNKFMVVGGGYNADNFSGTGGSLDTALFYNSAKTIVAHSGIQSPKSGGGLKNLPSIYHAALYLGRTAGLEPQVPSTWKDIRISSPVHTLNKTERTRALMAGVIHDKYVDGKGWVINQSINTLQKNDILVTVDGESYEVSIERIKAQLNKELVLNSRLTFVGGNYNTSSAIDVKLFTEGYLTFRTARPNQDNLIISFQDVKVKLVGDAWEISYGFVPNGPINKLFFTGILLDANIRA